MWPAAERVPLLVIAGVVAAYWYRVVRMARKQRQRTGKAANLIPPEPLGRVLRLVWFPVIVVWVVHPALNGATTHVPLAALRSTVDPGWAAWPAAAVVLAAFAATRRCWRRMGRSWRMGIDPGEKTGLVYDGLFAYVRHPIYALSALMMAATMAALPTPLMLAAGVLHVGLLLWESAREERHLAAVHGTAYENYRRHVGRIVPRSFRAYVPQETAGGTVGRPAGV
jgi:protein-S-isoprenylcysteine O-methyltransferase Ste14